MSTNLSKMRFPSTSDIKIERMRRSLAEFIKEAWKIVEPATPLIWNWHMDAVCEHVQALVQLKLGKNNLIINVPPGTSKSTIISVCLPAWLWIDTPEFRGVFASGNPRVSSRDSVKCRMILESRWYRETFGIKWQFRRDQNAKLSYSNSLTGERVATTSNARITGERYRGLFVDDALDAQKAFSQNEVDAVNINWWDNGFYNRISDQKTGVRCITGQRLREDDLPGYVYDRDPSSWERLVIPQEWEETQRRVTFLGWTDPRKEEGELLFPARFSSTVLATEKIVLGLSGYEGQHQQRPSMLRGEIFKRGYAQFIYPPSIPVSAIQQTVISWDTAVKTDQSNDWSVSLVGVQFDKGVLISEETRIKTGYPGLKEATLMQAGRVRPHALLVEDKQTGQALIQELQQNTSLPVVPVQVSTDKVARSWPLVPYWESNRVFFPCDVNGKPEEWVEPFLAEIYSFPKAPHDDRVDAFTQLLNYLILAGGGGAGLISWYQAQIASDKLTSDRNRLEDARFHPIQNVELLGAKR